MRRPWAGSYGGMPRFRDRRDAGERLAQELSVAIDERPVLLGIPRGGVVVADAVARRFEAPLDVLVVRKLGYPRHEEAGFGAIGEDDVLVPESLAHLGPDDPGYEVFVQVLEAQRAEVAKRVERYRGGRPRIPIAGTTAVVVDDGIATGFTFACALEIARRQGPRRLIAAAPVASGEGASLVSSHCDELVTLGAAERGRFFAVSLYYDHFPQVSDEEVVELLSSQASGEPREPPVG